jgi:hypothetical protein
MFRRYPFEFQLAFQLFSYDFAVPRQYVQMGHSHFYQIPAFSLVMIIFQKNKITMKHYQEIHLCGEKVPLILNLDTRWR